MEPLLRDELTELLSEYAQKQRGGAASQPPSAAAPPAAPRRFQAGRVAGFALLGAFGAFLWWTGLFAVVPGQDVLAHLQGWITALPHETLALGVALSGLAAAVLTGLCWVCWRYWVP
jgi:hypothetical protein